MGAVEVQVRLMGVKPVPVVGVGHQVSLPVGGLKVPEDEARPGMLLSGVAPGAIAALPASGRGLPGPLEPEVQIRGLRVITEMVITLSPRAVSFSQVAVGWVALR